MTNKVGPWYRLVKAVIAKAVQDNKPMHGVTKEFWEDAYWTLKDLYLMSGESAHHSNFSNLSSLDKK